ncbi:MAG: uroporphyrinogen decarboxylase family protein [Spirochaetales bacterium]|nr:uroporphyrinogen decarboxylase family protein [Spirochaetales bacterium]
MQSKERIINALNGKETDRIPWSPFLAYFWEHQPAPVRAKGQLNFLEEIGADPMLRGADDVPPATVRYRNCRIDESVKGSVRTITYSTPVGELREVYTFSQNSWFITEHSVKSFEDLQTFLRLQELVEVQPNIEALNGLIARWGERGLVVPILGLQHKSSFQSFVEKWFGTEELVYKLMDHPEEIKACLDLMYKNSARMAEIAAMSDGEFFISWEDTSTTNISPAWYEEFILPEINSWCDILHSSGKKYIQHACGHLKDLMPLIGKSRIDALESVSPPPTGNIEFEEAGRLLPDHIALIGGIEPVFFEQCSLDELESRVLFLCSEMKGRPFVLANSDSCPPGVSREKMELVSGLMQSK